MNLIELTKIFQRAECSFTPYPTWEELAKALNEVEKDHELHAVIVSALSSPLSWDELKTAVKEKRFAATVAHCQIVSKCVAYVDMDRSIPPATAREGKVLKV